jgi:N-acetylmuramoyl-L-alanine amidase
VTRIVLSVNSVSGYFAFFLPNPPRLIIDVHGRGGAPATEIARSVFPPAAAPAHRAAPRSVQTSVFPGADSDVDALSSQPGQVRATPYPTTAPVASSVVGTTPAAQPESWRRRTHRSAGAPVATPAVSSVPSPAGPATETLPAQAGVPTSMVRALGLKINRIVIDPGHGGHDSGALGPGGIEEKDVVLDVALRLGRLLHDRLGSDVIYTRKTDTFVPLETRTAIANQAQADLFISIHANSSSDPTVRGVETYYLNFTTSADALEVAARENAVSDESIFQLSSLVKKIALQSKIDESREFAADVDESLYEGLEQGNPGFRNRGVKKAPFVVLIGANMPSILVEISFLTNPASAEELRRPAYRERIAEGLYRGVAEYVASLNGVRVAQAGARPASSE